MTHVDITIFHLRILFPQSNVDPRDEVFSYHHQFDDKPSSKSEDRKEYNIGVLRHLQVIFGHLAASRLQYYVPRGFWKQFRYCKDSFVLSISSLPSYLFLKSSGLLYQMFSSLRMGDSRSYVRSPATGGIFVLFSASRGYHSG